jgi:carbamoyl-phosphate synthase small subunit
MTAILVLEDGTTFEGESFGAQGECTGEVVFNTSMTGYQEVLTDPSYNGQIVTMTYPLIGNTGVNPDDMESRKPQIHGFVVREYCSFPSNWRSTQPLGEYLKEQGIPAIEDVDTRMLTRHIRAKGAMKGILSTVDFDIDSLMKKLEAYPGLVGQDLCMR